MPKSGYALVLACTVVTLAFDEGVLSCARRHQLKAFCFGVTLLPQGAHSLCDDTCIYEKRRKFQRAGRLLELKQEFGPKAGTGMGIWECAEVLSTYLDTHPEIVSGQRVLELGSGPGLVSLVAALNGADAVQATDGDPEVLALARSNLDANGATQVETRLMRWEEAAATEQPFDLVLGADLTYYPQSVSALVNALLASGAPLAYITHKRRRGATDDATIATIEREFGPAEIVNRIDTITLFKFTRRSNAPPDLTSTWDKLFAEGYQCNPGYRPISIGDSRLCVPSSSDQSPPSGTS